MLGRAIATIDHILKGRLTINIISSKGLKKASIEKACFDFLSSALLAFAIFQTLVDLYPPKGLIVICMKIWYYLFLEKHEFHKLNYVWMECYIMVGISQIKIFNENNQNSNRNCIQDRSSIAHWSKGVFALQS